MWETLVDLSIVVLTFTDWFPIESAVSGFKDEQRPQVKLFIVIFQVKVFLVILKQMCKLCFKGEGDSMII